MTQLGQMLYEDGLKAGEAKGLVIGIEKGIVKGREREKLEIARKMLDLLPDEEIAEITELPLAVVKRLRSERGFR